MPQIELPHTIGCLVCGRENPVGLRLSSFVDTDTGEVTTQFTPHANHIGFDGIIHGGILATVLDELMVWAAIWAGRRACVAGELSLRFRKKVAVGQTLTAVATVTRNRSRLIETAGELKTDSEVYCTAAGKYTPLPDAETGAFFKTLVDELSTTEAIAILTGPRP